MAVKERVAVFDNLKFVLIALVLVGHFGGSFTDDSHALYTVWRWIYLFHMPAFIFVTGMFSKKMYTPQRGLRVNAIVFYLLMFVSLYTLLWAWKHLYSAHPAFDLFNVGSIPWYFLTLATLAASTPIAARIKGGAKVVLPLTVVIAVAAGFSTDFDDFLALGRSATYAPFYYLGFFLPVDRFVGVLEKARSRPFSRVLAAVGLVGVFLFLYLVPDTVASNLTGNATGHNPFEKLRAFPSWVDAIVRVFIYPLSSMMTFAIALLIPSKRCFITELGSRTLQVYFIHPFIYYPFAGLKLYAPLLAYQPWSGALVMAGSVVLAGLLAAPKAPARVFEAIRQKIQVEADIPSTTR